jgi:hypothetical protein
MNINALEFRQLLDICERIQGNSLEDNYDIYTELRAYDTFTNKDLLKAFIVSNFNGIDHSYIDRFINDNFLEINAVSKSLIGSNLEILPKDIIMEITSYIKLQ